MADIDLSQVQWDDASGHGFDTQLSPQEERSFAAWKQKYAPNDSGVDYDLRGAFKANLKPDPKSGHWPDTFKKPNHPTFSDQSQYARFGNPGHWEGETFVPPSTAAHDLSGVVWDAAPQEPDSRATRLVRGAAQPVVDAAQLMSRPLAVVGKGVNAVSPGSGDFLESLPASADAQAAQLRTDQKRGAPEGVDWAGIVGQTLVTAPLGALKLAQAAPAAGALARAGINVLNRTAQGAATGAALSNSNDQGVGENVGIGAAAANVIPPALQALSRVVKPAANAAASALSKEGVTLTPGQIVGGWAKRAEDAATSIPLVGDLIRNSQRQSFESFNRVAINKTLQPLNVKLPADVKGRDAIDFAQTKLSDAYNAVLPKLNAKADPQFIQDAMSLNAMARNLPEEQRNLFDHIFQKEFIGKFTSSGLMNGATLKDVESQLGQLATGFYKDPNPYVRQLAGGVREMQATLRELVARNNPDEAARLNKINLGYAMFKRVQDAASKTTSQDGIFTPEALASSVRKLDKSKDKSAFARGDALMQDFAEGARGVMGRSVPDSGTPLRMGVGGVALGGLHTLSPASAMTLGAVALPYLPGGRQITQNMLLNRPVLANYLARALQSPAAAPLGVPMANALATNAP